MAKQEVWHYAEYDAQDIRAMQALERYARGAERPWPPGEEPPVPSPHDVKRALDWIMYGAAKTYGNPAMDAFEARDPNLVWFMAGRASVGQQITRLLQLKPSILENTRDGRSIRETE